MRDNRNIQDILTMMGVKAHAAERLRLSGNENTKSSLTDEVERMIAELHRMRLLTDGAKFCHGADLIAMELGYRLIAIRGAGSLTMKMLGEWVDEAKGRMDGPVDSGGPVSVHPAEGNGSGDGTRLHVDGKSVPQSLSAVGAVVEGSGRQQGSNGHSRNAVAGSPP